MSLAGIATTLRATAGIEIEALGARHLADAVGRLTARAGVDAEAYAELVAADVGARESLVGELLVHETSFFRYPASYRHLAGFAVGRAAARTGPVRMLSAACATGQEPYSIAIALLEAGLPPTRVSVDAFDRSASAIEKGRAGRFDRGAARGLDPERAARWFEKVGDGLSIVPAVRALVHFETGNLLDANRPFAEGSYDAIFCRNVLIYLTEDARRRVLTTICASLAPDGVLYLGHAEVLVARALGFVPVPGPATYACVVRSAAAAKAADEARSDAQSRVPPRIVGPASSPSVRSVPVPAAPSALKSASSPISPRIVGPASSPSVRSVPVPAALSASKSASAPISPPISPRDLADAGRLVEACALLEAEVARGKSDADTFHLLALVRRALGRAKEADEALGRALYLDPSHVGALLLAAVAAEGRGERNVAARLHARARAAFEGRG